MVKFSHSVFALPFALSGAALAALESGITLRRIVWIVVAMIAARNAAMSFNRLADQRYDSENPRTSGRELPSGRLSRNQASPFSGSTRPAKISCSSPLRSTGEAGDRGTG